ncbi:hypothetical protein [Streptomyces lydicus]|uniref:hypothetical protein n=1 Tax=Streptomyces lydicus TaxID=47763 RepID=UPI0037B1C8E3
MSDAIAFAGARRRVLVSPGRQPATSPPYRTDKNPAHHRSWDGLDALDVVLFRLRGDAALFVTSYILCRQLVAVGGHLLRCTVK